ncbi:MAG: amidophosphoribosyltransferase [bacterium]|nr:amidophosphoribosyltransferase [bacterium]
MCGVFGFTGHPEAKQILPVILASLQHRGHDATGIAGLVAEGPNCIDTIKEMGRASRAITTAKLDKFIGDSFIAHTRYSTRNSSSSLREIHPHWAQSMQGRLVIVTNGDLLNVDELLEYIAKRKVKVYTKNDAEIIAALINIQIRLRGMDMMESITEVMRLTKGGYAGVVMTEDDPNIYAFRDPWGIRPLHYAEFNLGGQLCRAVSSETCSFDLIQRYDAVKYPDGAYQTREVAPGEIISFSKEGTPTNRFHSTRFPDQLGCVFEAIYFSRPDSILRGVTYQTLRERMGKQLFQEAGVEADLVTAVPKGGIPSAVGYAKAAGLPYSVAILEEPSTGGLRSFTTNPKDRMALAKMKYSILKDVVLDKRVVVVDDSIVRGTTAKLLVKSLYEAGAKEVHLRIPCPPYNHPCHYGIETKDPKTLLSHGRSNQEICEILGAHSLYYLSIDGLYEALDMERSKFCDECLSGRQPFDI